VGGHEGGYTAWRVDVAKALGSGGLVAVEIDNRPGLATIPGWAMKLERSGSVWYDWWHYGGIVRDVPSSPRCGHPAPGDPHVVGGRRRGHARLLDETARRRLTVDAQALVTGRASRAGQAIGVGRTGDPALSLTVRAEGGTSTSRASTDGGGVRDIGLGARPAQEAWHPHGRGARPCLG
jgi:hypothetical protein